MLAAGSGMGAHTVGQTVRPVRAVLRAGVALAVLALAAPALASPLSAPNPGGVLSRPAAHPPKLLNDADMPVTVARRVESAPAVAAPSENRAQVASAAAETAWRSAAAAPSAQVDAPAPAAMAMRRLDLDGVDTAPAATPDADRAPTAQPTGPSPDAAPRALALTEADRFGAALAETLSDAPTAIQEAYAAGGGAPIWITPVDGGLDLARAAALIEALTIAPSHALPLERYAPGALRARLNALGAEDAALAAALEVDLARTYWRFARDVGAGLIDPRSVSRGIDVDRPTLEPIGVFAKARGADDIRWLLEGLAPRTADYAALKQRFNELRDGYAAADWGAPVPGQRSLRRMDRGVRVAALRDRLGAMGFLDASLTPTLDPQTGEVVFDEALHQAVFAFQEKKGLVRDGIVGVNTLSQINQDPGVRAAQLALNLERARWHNRPLGQRRIVVNIPEFMARIYSGDVVEFETRVVVGKPKHPTVEFSDEMTHMVVNPRWHVPYSIATQQYLPILQQDPYAMQARNISILSQSGAVLDPGQIAWSQYSRGSFPYRMRQESGPGNALGDVKFMFPNKHAIYLHDTPSKSLFNRTVRAYSHGCVRVADPVALAEALLGADHADPAGRYQQLSSRRGEQYEYLGQPLPVHIIYRTAWVDAAGALQLRRDIYGRDRRLAQALVDAGVSFD